MIVRSFDDSESGGFDPRNYASIGAEGKVSIITTSPTTLIDIMGEGFLSRAVSGYVGGNAPIPSTKIKITIDGVTLFYSTLAGSCGFIMDDDIRIIKNESANTYSSVVRVLGHAESNANGYGYASIVGISARTTPSISARPFLILTNPLFFFSSCKVEIETSVNANETNYSISGGLLT